MLRGYAADGHGFSRTVFTSFLQKSQKFHVLRNSEEPTREQQRVCTAFIKENSIERRFFPPPLFCRNSTKSYRKIIFRDLRIQRADTIVYVPARRREKESIEKLKTNQSREFIFYNALCGARRYRSISFLFLSFRSIRTNV